MIKRLLLVIAALAMSVGTAAAVSIAGPSVAGAAAPPPTTISCTVTGAVTFASPGLSAGGALTANGSVTTKSTTTATGTGCGGTPSSETIASTTTPCPQTNGVPNSGDPSACLASKTKDGVVTYAIAQKPNYYDTDNSYASSGLTDLETALQAKPPKATVDSIPVVLAYGSASEVGGGGVCGSDVGFDITGNAQIKGATVGTYTDIVCISGDSGSGTTGNFAADLFSSTAVIQSATVGGDSSLTVVIPSASCPVTGAVTFASPGLSAGGALTANGSVTTKSTTTATGTGCGGTPSSETIASTTTPCPQTNGVPNSGDPSACLASKTKDGVVTYSIAQKPNYYDTDNSYASTGLTDLETALQAKPPKATIDAVPVVLAYGSASEVGGGGACGSNVGFDITGNAELKGATVGTYTDIVCLVGDSGSGTTGNFAADLFSSTAVIQSATIGGDSSLTVIF